MSFLSDVKKFYNWGNRKRKNIKIHGGGRIYNFFGWVYKHMKR